MNNLIVSQGSMLAGGTLPPNIPGTVNVAGSSGSTRSTGVGQVTSQLITAASSPTGAAPSVVIKQDLPRENMALVRAAQATGPARRPNPTQSMEHGGKGPSTFLKQVLGGHLPMSWLFAGPKGR